MRRILHTLIVLTSSLVLFLTLSMASDYAFGSKVMPNDNDSGRLLKSIPDGTIISFWDIGSDLGFYDPGDVVYLDMPPIGIVNVNDIRLTQFGVHSAGTKVKPNDDDINAPLKPMQAEIGFLNLNGGRSYTLNDPVYIIQSDSPVQSNTGNTNSPISDTIPIANTSKGTASTATNIANINPNEESDSVTAESTKATENTAPCSEDNADANEGYRKRLSYSGSCSDLPKTTACLMYSDNYVWIVSDLRIDNYPIPVGVDNRGFPIEAFRCYNADYYHILGTLLVRSIPKGKTLFIQSAPNQEVTGIGSVPEYAGDAVGSNPDVGAVTTPNRISSNTRSIRTNDIRLTLVNGLAAGTRVQNFEPDLNMPVAYTILASFPKRADDYAGIRVYDTNGNGLYDSEDDVYLDISFPGYSSFGTVSINDVRLSGPSA